MSNNNEHLREYLRNLRVRSDVLVQLKNLPNWNELAQQRIQRNAVSLVSMLDDELVVAIANGNVDVNAVIDEVLTNG